jgi:hypothetical protein
VACRADQVDAHHHSLRGAGTARKAPDRDVMPLCNPHHVAGLHGLAGPFKGWTREQLLVWQDDQVERCQELYRRAGGVLARAA